MTIGFGDQWNTGAVWDPIRRVWTTQASLNAGEPQQVIQGWGEGFSNDVYQDNFGRTFAMVDNPIGGEGAQTFVQTEGYNGIWGQGNPMPGELAPIHQLEQKASTRLGDMMPKDFYTGNLSADTLDYMVPYGSEWGHAMAMAGAPVESYKAKDVYNNNDASYTNKYFSTLKGDYTLQPWGKDGQDFGFVRYETDSIWGADPKITRDVLLNQIAPKLGASYEEVARAAQQAQSNFYGSFGQGYTEATSPLDVIQNTFNILAQNKGIQPTALFDEATLTQSRADAQARQDMLKKQDEEQSGFMHDAMQIISSPGFGMLMGFGAPMISSWASAMSGAAQASTLGAADLAHLPEWGSSLGTDLTSTFDKLFGSFADIGFDPAITEAMYGAGGYEGLYGAGVGGVMSMNPAQLANFANSPISLDSYADFSRPGYTEAYMQQNGLTDPSQLGQYPDAGLQQPEWLQQALEFAGGIAQDALLPEPTLDDMGYQPEDDSGGLGIEDAIFRSNKQRKGVPGSGFTSFNVGAPGLFIP